MSALLAEVEEFIRERSLLPRHSGVLAAVSGGMDSMVMLSILHELTPRFQWRLSIAHFNHQLRGAESEQDEALVRETAAASRLEVIVGHGQVRAAAEKDGVSIEMAARRLRHEFLASSARSLGLSTIAVGHHSGDQVELFFLRLLRGAGGEGLAGMRAGAASPADAEIRLVRPLLGCAREQIGAFARERGVRFAEDRTNRSVDVLRNRIRHELLPRLRRDYQPALDATVLRMMDIVGEESRVVRDAAAEWLGQTSRAEFSKLPVAVQRRVLQLQLTGQGIEPAYELIERLRRFPDQPIMVSPTACISRDRDGRVKVSPVCRPSFQNERQECVLTGNEGAFQFGGLNIGWTVEDHAGPEIPHAKQCEFLDADKVGSAIVLRHWMAGDRFWPLGLAAPTKLQDLFVNSKIPAEERRRLVLAATDEGKIVWVENLRASEEFKLHSGTVRRLKWCWSR